MFSKVSKPLVLLLIISFVVGTTANAVEIQPRWATIAEIAPSLTINSLGRAEASGNVIAPGVDRITITVALEQNRNGKWYTVKSWNKTVYNDYGYCIGYSNVSSGYQYRTKIYASTYVNNTLMESTSVVSRTIYY